VEPIPPNSSLILIAAAPGAKKPSSGSSWKQLNGLSRNLSQKSRIEMGDIADELFDRGLAEEFRIEQEVTYWLGKSDDELKENTKTSRLPIIVSIRKFAKLSLKQRAVLARWLAEAE
jgi:hypothetical protein